MKRGFSLVELLIVVLIIAILAVIAIPNYLEAQTRSKVAAVKANMRTVATDLEAYQIDYGKYPAGFASWADSMAIPGWPSVWDCIVVHDIVLPTENERSINRPMDPFRAPRDKARGKLNSVGALTYFNMDFMIWALANKSKWDGLCPTNKPIPLCWTVARRRAGAWMLLSLGPTQKLEIPKWCKINVPISEEGQWGAS